MADVRVEQSAMAKFTSEGDVAKVVGKALVSAKQGDTSFEHKGIAYIIKQVSRCIVIM